MLLSLCFFLGVAFSLQGCTSSEEPVLVITGETMGTYYQVKVVGAGEEFSAAKLQQVTDEALVKINDIMSTYIPDSELMRLNRSSVGAWVDISEPLYDVLVTSQRISELSGGAFDITVAPLVNLWGFGPKRSNEPPTEQAVSEALEQIGYQYLEVRPGKAQVRRTRDVQLDLSAVAKGYGADYVAQVYRGMGLENFMVEIGGELRLAGHNPNGEPWRIGVEVPSVARTGVVQAVEVTNAGVATSGDYRNYYEVDGKRVSHTIDPATGHPITHTLASVTVIADTAADADALATALNVMGAEKGRELADKAGIAAYFIERQNDDFVSSYSEEFKQYLP